MCNLAIYGSVPPSVSSASAIIIARGATGNLQLALDLTVSQRLGRYFVIVKYVTYHQKVPDCLDYEMEKAS